MKRKSNWGVTAGTFLLMVAGLFTSIFFVALLSSALIPWDSHGANDRPSPESAEGRLNNYFEYGGADYILYGFLIFSIAIIVLRFVIKREKLNHLFLNTASAYGFYVVLTIFEVAVIVIAFRPPGGETRFHFTEIGVYAVSLLILFILQYALDVTEDNPKLKLS